jgi:hypothetical protein
MIERTNSRPETYLPVRGEIFPIVMNKTADDLRDCAQVLEILPASTEDEFLSVGAKLRDFHDRAERISSVAGSVAGLMSGDQMAGAIEGLKDLIEMMEVHQKKSESDISLGIAKLKHITDIIDDIHEQLEELAGITRSLRTLGFSTMIQNASLKRPDGGIQLLGEDVKKLSASVAEKSSNLVSGTKNLNEVIRGSILTLNTLEAEQRIKAAAVIKSTTASIRYLEEKYGLSASVAHEISAGSEEISRSIGNIVTSLQFHDITRQLFEHSKTVFDKMLDIFAASPPSEADWRQFFSGLTEFCEHEDASLCEGRDVFVGAVERVMENLGITAAGVRETIKKTEKIARADRSAGGSFLSEIEAALSSVMVTVSALSESALVEKELSETVKQVVAITGEMSGFILGIEEIGDEVELIAFNAAIKADHIGGEGKPLGVVAEFVQRISGEAPIYTTAISKMIKAIASSAEELSRKILSADKDSAGEISGMAQTLREMVGSFRGLNKEIISSCSEIDGAGQTLSKDIEGVITDISVHDEVAHALDSVLVVLRRISRSARSAMPDMDLAKEPGGRACLPLETGTDMHETSGLIYVDPRKFGDNVELF